MAVPDSLNVPSLIQNRYAPSFKITIQNNPITYGIRELIQQVEYESVDGMADMCRLQMTDSLGPDGKMRIRDSKLFMPGNDLSIWLGYGTQLTHVGRVIIRKVRPTYPPNGAPTIEVVGYTADSLMADSAPEALKETRHLKKGGTRLKNSKVGRRWKDARFSDAVKDRAEAYGFLTDVDTTTEPPTDFYQKANMTDYDFVQGLANLTGFIFWVDGDENGQWTLHFKDPSKLTQADLQEKEYNFKYGDGDFSTLLSFEPELAINGSITKLLVQMKDPETGKVFEARIEEENDDSPDIQVEPGNTRPGATPPKGFDSTSGQPGLSVTGNEIKGPLTTASDMKIYIDDFSFDVRANRRFTSEAQLASWAAQWFRKNRENFLLSQGVIIGLENVMARQIHTLSGIGTAFSGRYQFTRVRHAMNITSGYTTQFSARKTVPASPPVTSLSEVQVEELLRG